MILAASPVAFGGCLGRPSTLGLVLIGSVYIGLSVTELRWQVIAVESGVATVFVVIAVIAVIAVAAVIGPAWLVVAGLTGHVANMRCRRPFCIGTDWIAAALLAAATQQDSPATNDRSAHLALALIATVSVVVHVGYVVLNRRGWR